MLSIESRVLILLIATVLEYPIINLINNYISRVSGNKRKELILKRV